MSKLKFKNTTAIFAAVFIIGLLVCTISEGVVWGIALAALCAVTACVLLAFTRNIHGKRRRAGILLLIFTLGMLVGAFAKGVYYYPAESILKQYADNECELVVRIDAVASRGDGYANYDCSIISCN